MSQKVSIDCAQVQRILIVRLSSLGDVLMATPVAQALREFLPHARIDWVVESAGAQILRDNPFLDNVHIWDRTLSGLVRVIKQIRTARYQLVLEFQGLLKSAIIAWCSGAPLRVGFSDGREGAPLFLTHRVKKPPAYHPCAMSLDLLNAIGIPASVTRHRMLIPISDDERRHVCEILQGSGLSPKTFITLAPATRWKHKHWLDERWAQLAECIQHEWRLHSVLIGGHADMPLIRRIQKVAQVPIFTFADALSLRESAHLIQLSALLIGVDSFPVHVGYAMGTPTIILYGPTSSQKWRDADGVTVIEHELPCRPCYRHPTCNAEFTCMKRITVEDVKNVIANFSHLKPRMNAN